MEATKWGAVFSKKRVPVLKMEGQTCFIPGHLPAVKQALLHAAL
jgi:hypothetical protein